MAEFPEGFDLAVLLAPIAGDAPAGVDLRSDASPQSLYYRLRDARADARASERAAEAAESEDSLGAPPSEWRTIRDLGIEAIAGYSKDLEIAGWLTEALLRSDGMPGFTAGVELMTGLAKDFWDDLFPLPDEDGVATRVRPVAGLNGQSGEGMLGPALPAGSAVPAARWRADGVLAVRTIRKSGQDRRRGNPPEAHRCRRPALRVRRKRGASR